MKRLTAINSVKNIMEVVREGITVVEQENLCKSLRIHPEGLNAVFPSKQLSKSSRTGYIEPLTTPMRHPDFCNNRKAAMDMKYMVHDYEAMCLSLKSTSRIVLIDMGASLSFHRRGVVPIVHLLNEYKKFGFVFDHIYGFEITQQDPNEVYNDLLPEEFMSSYHWINVGVNATHGGKLNPLDSILRSFNEDDLVVVKLDVDTTSVEVPLAKQLLNDDSLNKLVDQFYFEHHVFMNEIAPSWGTSMEGSLKDTFDLFSALREKAVAAHFWP
mmetsp:Transcript_8811/g.12836  ORF Transcript_8811/g.12836 Transcript_8811/m.12836 type:complete len:270 (+) Transcript_8811:504-1313(+)